MSKISENIIIDLLPLYHANRLSDDSLKLVDDYFSQNPQFAEENKMQISLKTPNLERPNEMNMLKKTRVLIMTKTFVLFVGIFSAFSTVAFGNVPWIEEEGIHWLWQDTPEVAILAGVVAIFCALIYLMINKYLKITEL